ncbi:MAG: beta-Ala-His dipeptidase [Promethearchaeota archaeon]
MQTLKDLGNPPDFWEYFYNITKIPRCSGKEEKIREYIRGIASDFNFETEIDNAGNLIVNIPSKEKSNSVINIILQSHMDMVCEKNENVKHNFSKDALKLRIIDFRGQKWLTADGTTLGADNGVGIAFSLTLMKKIYQKEINFESLNINFLFTVNEESGLIGAANIDKNLIKGNYLINLDSEEDNKFVVGCAGGINTSVKIGYAKENLKEGSLKEIDFQAFKIIISGLIGGHSGVDIHRGRANALKIVAKIMRNINKEYNIHLNSINGGNRPNAIPRESEVIFFVEKNDIQGIKEYIKRISKEIVKKFQKVDSNIKITLEQLKNFSDLNYIPDIYNKTLFSLLFVLPNGPISMHPEIKDLVHTSINLASIRTDLEAQTINIITSERSLNEASKIELCEQIEDLFKLTRLSIRKIEHNGNYPGWEPNFETNLLLIAKNTYRELFNEDAIINAIHAGLECGILKKHFPEMQMISIGPLIEGAHSPDEKLKIKSIEKFWNFLLKLLYNIK